MCCSDKQEDAGAVKAQESGFEQGSCSEIIIQSSTKYS